MNALSGVFCTIFISFFHDYELVTAQDARTCRGEWANFVTVTKDDCLSQMAHAYQTSVEELLSKNKFIKDENLIEIGWVLCIPSWADVTVTPRKCIKRVLKPEEVRVAPTKKLRKQRTSTTLAPDGTDEMESALSGDSDIISAATATTKASTTSTITSTTSVPASTLSEKQQAVLAGMPGTLDPNVVQCQFFDNGFANCWKTCTADEFEYAVDLTTQSKIVMRQCIENKPPAIHTWETNDGILMQWHRPALKKEGQTEQILAACVFTRTRQFTCTETTLCKTNEDDSDKCSGGMRWNGTATSGDPLKENSVLKGKVTFPPGKSINLPPNKNAGRKPRQRRQSSSDLDDLRGWPVVKKRPVDAVDTTSEEDTIDRTISQCQYMDDHSVLCETECSSDPKIVVLDATKQQKVMLRDCDKLRTPVKHWWNQADGILDSSVYPEQTPDPAHVQLIAVCTFVLNGPVFECAGTAICDDSGTGIDACIGGVPWRGMRWTGHPLQRDSTITGNITAYAQNSDAGSAPQNMVTPIKTSEATTISTSTEEMDGSDNSPAGFSQVTVKPFTSQGEGNLGPQQHRGGPRGISSRRPVTARSTTDPSSFASSGCFSTDGWRLQDCGQRRSQLLMICTVDEYGFAFDDWKCWRFIRLETGNQEVWSNEQVVHHGFFGGIQWDLRQQSDNPDFMQCKFWSRKYECTSFRCYNSRNAPGDPACAFLGRVSGKLQDGLLDQLH